MPRMQSRLLYVDHLERRGCGLVPCGLRARSRGHRREVGEGPVSHRWRADVGDQDQESNLCPHDGSARAVRAARRPTPRWATSAAAYPLFAVAHLGVRLPPRRPVFLHPQTDGSPCRSRHSPPPPPRTVLPRLLRAASIAKLTWEGASDGFDFGQEFLDFWRRYVRVRESETNV